jgi:hypothetical protein
MFTEGMDQLPAVKPDHPNYGEICELLGKTHGEVDVQEIFNLLDTADAFAVKSDGRITVEGNKVIVNGMELPRNLADRMLLMMKEGYGLEPFILFCENLSKNPSMASVQQLFTFLQYRGLPITEDGCFLAYKGVTHDYKDKWTKTIDNSVGEEVSMPRNQVMDDPEEYCGQGLHAGDLDYANGWAGSDGVLVLVKVNPRDAVSVPNDGQKLRCCRYKVVADHEGRNLLAGSLVTMDGVTADPSRFTPAERPEPVNINPASGYFEDADVDEEEECDICGYVDCECCPNCGCYHTCECEDDDDR